ncbi:LysE family transporter [Microtetraspora sp. AC03309]|uniref:LysE family translocator n=1 Tax=Microtetraspora sp. AC03309 TaxID=2779376 RepID=UPI0035B08F72|nr:LysE family transporter [Microtetraspora sp. AC03309]
MRELLLGLSLGLGAGVAPGALLGLVITASLRGGFRAGLGLACVPLLSDLPVVLLSVTAVGALPGVFLRVLAVVGGLYVVHLAISAARESRTARPPEPGVTVSSATGSSITGPSSVREVLRGVAVNMLNPHPWLFWIAVGAPIFAAAWERTPAAALAFTGGFYLVLVGSKVVLAAMVGAGRHRLGVRGYRVLLAGSALLMAVTGLLLLVRGVTG